MGENRRPRSVFGGLKRAFWNDPARRHMTEQMPIIDDRLAQSIIDLAMRVAEVMLSIGASAKEVTLAALRITTAYGLKSVHVNVTFNSVMLSDHRNGTGDPITLMQVVRSAAPDHAKLQRLQALVNEIESGLPLHDAITDFHKTRRIPFMYGDAVVIFVQGLLGVAVALMYGAGPVTLVLVLIAALMVALAQYGLGRLRIPLFFLQAAGGLVLVAFAAIIAAARAAGIEMFDGVRPSVVVASGIVMMLAGLAVVGAAQDAIDGFSLTVGGRILDIAVMTMGLVVGIVTGLEIARQMGYGLEMPASIAFGPPLGHLAGAMLIAAAVAVLNGSGLRIIVSSTILGAAAWAGWYVLATLSGAPHASAVFGGALVASFVGSVIADRLSVPSIAVTTAAMIPMVPGTAVFQGLLGFVSAQADPAQFLVAFDSLFTAGLTGIALAAGATLGLMIGSPLRLRLGGRKVLMRAKARPVSAAGGTAAFEIVRTEPEDPIAAEYDDPHPLTKPNEPEE